MKELLLFFRCIVFRNISNSQHVMSCLPKTGRRGWFDRFDGSLKMIQIDKMTEYRITADNSVCTHYSMEGKTEKPSFREDWQVSPTSWGHRGLMVNVWIHSLSSNRASPNQGCRQYEQCQQIMTTLFNVMAN